MSNKIVPAIYRSVIDEVVAAIRPAFDELGLSDDVLHELQHKWESKIIASRVAEFDPGQPTASSVSTSASSATSKSQSQTHAASALPLHHPHLALPYPAASSSLPRYTAYIPPSAARPPMPMPIKPEPADPRYPPAASYALPALPGPQLGVGVGAGGLNFPGGGALQMQGLYRLPQADGAGAGYGYGYGYAGHRLPQTDGPSAAQSDDDDDEDDEQGGGRPMYAPRTAHPSLPQPQPRGALPGNGNAPPHPSNGNATAKPNASSDAKPNRDRDPDDDADAEAINSDLDDSDTENEEDAEGDGAAQETDIVFCTYDKVARVKNKWKCVLKDGMIHTGGRDWLFQRCTGEFEW